ncbi:MAG: hypothetical protein M3133_01915 [Actinomycetota bacterium]|nr:hypothetical protein [Actinomycetota bacterium]
MPKSAKVLVVANRTAASDELLQALQDRAAKGPASFTLVAPATPRGRTWILGPDAGQLEEAQEEAQENMQAAVKRLRAAGLEVEGRIGDPDPVAAAQDAVNEEDFDEVVVSTLPSHMSKWLGLDVPHRVERATGLPFTHVSASDAPA